MEYQAWMFEKSDLFVLQGSIFNPMNMKNKVIGREEEWQRLEE